MPPQHTSAAPTRQRSAPRTSPLQLQQHRQTSQSVGGTAYAPWSRVQQQP
jgi:hypothetical protein